MTYYSQGKIDEVIRETFFPDFNYKGIMVEVGAGPTLYASMSRHFRENGWRCICIEPNPKFCEQHKNEGNEIYEYACSYEDGASNFVKVSTPTWHKPENDGCSISSIEPVLNYDKHHAEIIEVKTIKLDTLLESLNIEKVDYVSIDVEGWELNVLKGFNIKKYSPKIIVVEDLGENVELEKYIESEGYKFFKKIEYNKIYEKQI